MTIHDMIHFCLSTLALKGQSKTIMLHVMSVLSAYNSSNKTNVLREIFLTTKCRYGALDTLPYVSVTAEQKQLRIRSCQHLQPLHQTAVLSQICWEVINQC